MSGASANTLRSSPVASVSLWPGRRMRSIAPRPCASAKAPGANPTFSIVRIRYPLALELDYAAPPASLPRARIDGVYLQARMKF